MSNVVPKGAWGAPLQQLSVQVSSRGAGVTKWSVTYRTAKKGDKKDVTAILSEGAWPKDVATKEDCLRALRAVVQGLERVFLTEE